MEVGKITGFIINATGDNGEPIQLDFTGIVEDATFNVYSENGGFNMYGSNRCFDLSIPSCRHGTFTIASNNKTRGNIRRLVNGSEM